LVRGEILAKIYFIAFIPLILLLLITSISDLGYLKQQLWFYLLQPFPILFENSILLMALAYRLYDFQRKKQQLEIEIDSKIIQAQETERQRIAQDLHDEVGNSLAALKNLISQNFKSSVLSDSVSQIAQEVRNISHNLASINFDKTTLSEAFQSLMSRHNEAGNIEFEYIEVGKYQKIDSDKELALYRIACELLNNIQKHSKAKKATFQLAYQPDVLTLLVEDDGIGIRSKGKNTDGIGLTNIHARVAYLDAKLTIDDDGRGTVIVIDIPYNKNNS
jgi:signal transduction histidine kinase